MKKSVARAILGCALAASLLGAPPARAQSPTELNVASIGGQLDVVFKEAFKPFEAQNHVSIRWVPAVSAENLAKVAAARDHPEFDIALIENLGHAIGSQQGLWSPVDESIVTNYKDEFAVAKPKHNDGVGVGVFLAGFFYNAPEFEKRGWAPPSSWNDLFRPEFCHHIGIMHPNVSYTLHTIIMLGGGDPAHADEGIARLSRLKDCIPVLEPSAAKFEEKVQMGEYLVGIHGNIRVGYLVQRGLPVKFVYPKEGTVVGVTMAAAVKGAGHPQLAQQFLNWFIRPDVQEQVMRGVFYGPGNSKVAVPEDLVQFGVPDAEVMKRMIYIDDSLMVDRRRDWVRQTERALSH